jgi:hypothetical protein
VSDLACHACKKVHRRAKSITLPGGQTVGSYSAEYKTYCEAKWVYHKAKSRFDYLEAIQKTRGKQAYEALRQAMLTIHYENK